MLSIEVLYPSGELVQKITNVISINPAIEDSGRNFIEILYFDDGKLSRIYYSLNYYIISIKEVIEE